MDGQASGSPGGRVLAVDYGRRRIGLAISDPTGTIATGMETLIVKSAEEAAQRLTQQIISIIEREIRSYPEHWLWMYKRWKKINRPEDSERYPFYAKNG